MTVYTKMMNRLDDFLTEGIIKNFNTSRNPLQITVEIEGKDDLVITEFDDNALLRMVSNINKITVKTKPVKTTPIKLELNVKVGDKVLPNSLDDMRDFYPITFSKENYKEGDDIIVSKVDELFDGTPFIDIEIGNGNLRVTRDYLKWFNVVVEEEPEEETTVDIVVEVGQEYELIDRDGFINHVEDGIDYSYINDDIANKYDRYFVYELRDETVGFNSTHQSSYTPYKHVTFDELSKYFKIKDLADNLSGENDEEVDVENVVDFLTNLFDNKDDNGYTKTIKEAIEQGKSLVMDIPSIKMSDIPSLEDVMKSIGGLIGVDEGLTKDFEKGDGKWCIKGVWVHKGDILVGGNIIPSRDEVFDMVMVDGEITIKRFENGSDKVISNVVGIEHFFVENGQLKIKGTFREWYFEK